MEENTPATECLILFYINMKQVLKTKQMIERVFLDQMIKYCKENGFGDYRDEEIKSTWKYLVSKYLSLKTKGTDEEKESWKYYEILDSCYEHSDFHNGVYPKFSTEMVWFLIECYLKRKALKKTQKQSSIVSEIHKEFLHYGYLYITKQDIENKWRSLNLKYEKLKHDSESLKKYPYLQALVGFHEDGRHVVNMMFTRELTEILIERFTEKKITCVIHGYDSNQVLSEIQSEFKDLGFYFSKDDIKDKWKNLTNVYKFIMVKGNTDTSWVYFNAMRNHFKDDLLFPWQKINKNTFKKQNDGKTRRLRQRSKSAGPEIVKRNPVEPDLVIQLEKVPPDMSKLKDEEKMRSSKKKSNKRSSLWSSHKRRRSKSRKKLKVDTGAVTKITENKNQTNEIFSGNIGLSERDSDLRNLSFDGNQERRKSADLGSPTSKVHIINIDHSDIDRSSGNLTINLPSITKQFSDNEFLPLKKRLRIEGDNVENEYGASKEIKNGFLGFPPTQVITQKLLMGSSPDKRLTEEEMLGIMERINRENPRNYDGCSKLDEISINHRRSEELNNYQNVYGNLGQQCLIVPKEERREDNLSMQNYNSPSTLAQPPVLLLVIKVDGSNNQSKDNVQNDVNLKAEGTSNPIKETESETNNTTEMSTNICNKQVNGQMTPKGFVKPISPKGKTIILSKKLNLVPLEVNYFETSKLRNNTGATVSKISESTTSQTNTCSSELVATENEQGKINNATLDNDLLVENNDLNDVCTVGENVTIYTSEENQHSQLDIKNKLPEIQKTTDEGVFREPAMVGKKTEVSTKPKVSEITSATTTENNAPSQTVKPLLSTGNVRLPVKAEGKLREIFISPRELNKIAKLNPVSVKVKNNLRKPVNKTSLPNGAPAANESVKKMSPEIKYVSQVIKPAINDGPFQNRRASYRPRLDSIASQSLDANIPIASHSFKIGSKFVGVEKHSRNEKNEEFENESVLSEAIGDDDGLKDNLLATVIDFQEQNNQEFIEIKNLMKQNNLLQRETNRLLRLMLEKK